MSEDPVKYKCKTAPDVPFVIAIDSREQTPITFPEHIRTKPGATLYTGDYSIVGLERVFSVERKSIADLIASVTVGRDRFERELHRMRGYAFKRLLVVGAAQNIADGNYRSRTKPQAVFASLHAFEVRYNVPFVFATESEAAMLIERWAYWFARLHLEQAAAVRKAANC